MNADETLVRLGLALAIGLLVGLERGWHERSEAEGERAAGLRTFGLIGLLGGIWGLLANYIGPIPTGLAFLAFAGALTLFRWRQTAREGTFGVTTVVAGFLTFAIGAYAALDNMTVAAAAGVSTAALLASKNWLHAWLRILTWPELRSALILLVMSFVILPVLPDRGFGPFGGVNPWRVWLMTVFIAGVSFIGYIAVKAAGPRYGALIAGSAGGLVSSTVTTVDLARRAKAEPRIWRTQLAGALLASAVMFARVGVVVAMFGPELLERLAGPLAAAGVITVGAAFALSASVSAPDDQVALSYRNPFDLQPVLGFGALLAAIVFLSRALTETLGGEGGIALAAITGVADVDAITLSLTEVAGVSMEASLAAIAILVAVTANSLSKSGLAVAIGGLRFGLGYLIVSALAISAGGVIALSQPWS